jgi:hypothetical protein
MRKVLLEMADNIAIGSREKVTYILNILLIIVNFMVAFVVIALKFSRNTYQEISNEIFSPDKALMDSGMLDFLLKKEIAFIVVLFLGLIVLKEIRISSIRKRLKINLAALIGLLAYAAMLLYMIYSPVITAA